MSLEGLNGLTSVGFLSIKNNSQLISLEALSNAIYSKGIDIIKNERLPSLKGLNNIQVIDYVFFSGLTIKENHALTSLEGLESLESAALSVNISNNDNLLTLKGLESLNLTVSTIITDNKSLVSLEGLSDIGQFQELIVKNNPVLEGLSNIGNPNFLYHVEITDNASLQSLSGLDSIMSLGNLVIENNDVLTDLSGLENLTEVRDKLKLTGNDGLTDIKAIQDIPLLDTLLDFSISNCISLSVCNLSNICEALDNNIPLDITGNATGCNDTSEVETSCSVTSTTAPYNLPDFTIAPNPNVGIFSIQGIEKGTYQIQNVEGRIIQNGDVKNDLFIDISTEVEGVYFISIYQENSVVTKQLIKL